MSSLEKYARGLYTAARFIRKRAEDGKTGLDWVNGVLSMSCDEEWSVKSAIPSRLQHAQNGVFGLGPALSRDFLKECGCLWLAKPDSHLTNVLGKLGLAEDSSSEKHADHLCEQIHLIAKTARDGLGDPSITPYRVDKTIWLLCTGNFYFDDMPKNLSPRDLLVSSLTKAALELHR